MLSDENFTKIVSLINGKGYSNQYQSIVLIEEMSELTKELSKIIRKGDEHLPPGLVEEFSHVLISMAVIQTRYPVVNEAILNEIQRKEIELENEI